MRDEASWLPDGLRKAMRACADQVDDVSSMERSFAVAELTRGDFGLAPGAEEIASAYVPERYESVAGYLKDLASAFAYLQTALNVTERTYRAANGG